MIKKGDTLIEVTIAVGIFSMIAIAIVAVMSNGVANAQTALESTLTREEIDSQAEALRFIHSSFISSVNSTDNKYASLWSAIAGKAIELGNTDAEQIPTLQYMPTNCEELYADSNINYQHAFVINPRSLGAFNGNNVSDVLIDKDSGKLKPAATYPRLVYGTDAEREATLLEEKEPLYRAEGIYVIAVKDKSKTAIGLNQSSPAFYDFYIRTCWYGNRSSDASTISTVIRLYDPEIVSSGSN